MILQELERPIIIAGPCAAESREQVLDTARQVAERGILGRASDDKPRTETGVFKGVRRKAISWYGEAARGEVINGIVKRKPAIIGTEIMLHTEVRPLVRGIRSMASEATVLMWLGARNQNNRIQEGIGRAIANDERIILGIKNPMWRGKTGEKHWASIPGHVMAGGASRDQLFLIHRGFDIDDGSDMRNPADFELAMRVKEATGLPMLIDPSHIAGNVEGVRRVALEAFAFERRGQRFDGLIIEVHPSPVDALTDSKQQITWDGFDSLIMGELDIELPLRRAA